jgi:S-adenosylmethionine:tRNA ribosyltransferase-isomerase
MDVSLFDYDLPSELIAQYPLAERDSSRLLMFKRFGQSFEDGKFSDLVEHLKPGDLLLLNNTKVFPARLLGRKMSGGRVEAFLVRLETDLFVGDKCRSLWQTLFKSSKRMRPGQELDFGSGLRGEVITPSSLETGLLALTSSTGVSVMELIETLGQMPLPPYIKRRPDSSDSESYQTVFADDNAAGAVAAPTAGLHFTPEILAALEKKGVEKAFITLHVGPGTFAPVRCQKVEDHKIHSEYFQLPEVTLAKLRELQSGRGRLIAVGSTVTRTLEYYAATGQTEGMCDLFIYPGFKFKMVDALLTNFHLPASTLMMLVSAFAGHETIMAAYRKAIELKFRFFSYGDAMLIEP